MMCTTGWLTSSRAATGHGPPDAISAATQPRLRSCYLGLPRPLSSAVLTYRRAMTRRRCRPAGCRDSGSPHAGSTRRRAGCVRHGGTGIRWASPDHGGAAHRGTPGRAGESRRSSLSRAPLRCGRRPARLRCRSRAVPSDQAPTADESEEARVPECGRPTIVDSCPRNPIRSNPTQMSRMSVPL